MAKAESGQQAVPTREGGDRGRATPPRRRWLRALVIAAVVLGVLMALVFVAPGPVARLVAAHQLDRLGIEAHGIESLEIDVWRRTIGLGPVRLRQGDGDYARLARAEVELGVRELIRRRLLVRSVRIDGLDLDIREGVDGALSVNGVPLPTASEAPAETGDETAEASTWLAGLGSIEVRDSTVRFQTAAGGLVTTAIERVALAGLRPWDADSPAVVALQARVNDIGIDGRGEARPFIGDRDGRFEIRLEDADLGRIERATGVLGLARSGGRLALTVRGTARAPAEGGLELSADGRAALAGIDLATADGLAVAAGSVDLDVDLRADLAADGAGGGQGTLTLGLAAGGLDLGDGTSLRLPSARLTAPDLAVTREPAGRLRVTATPSIDVERPAVEGALRLAAEAIALALPATTVSLDGDALSVAARPTVRVTDLRLSEPVALAAAELSLALGELALEATGETATVDAAGSLRLERVALAGPAALSAERIGLDLATLALQSRPGELTLGATGTLELAPAALVLADDAGTPALRAGADRLGAAFRDLRLRQTDAETTLTAALRLDGGALSALLPYDGGEARLGGEQLTIALEPLSLRQTAARTALEASGSAEIGGIGAELPAVAGAPAISAAIATVQLAPAEVTLSLAGEDAALEARFDASNEELTAAIGGGELARARLATLRLQGGRLAADGGLAADALVLRRPDVEISDRLFAAFTAPPAAPPAGEARAPAPGLAIGRIAVADGGTLVFVDGSVRPPLRLRTDLAILEATGLDTADPERRTDLRLDSVVNEFSKVQLVGWIQPFASVPSFDLSGRIGDLELPAFSPYAAQAVGLNLERGRLSARLDARSSAGSISGRADLDVDNLGFSALSKDDAERLSARMGVPIETVVGLLQDSRGRIALNIPVSGDLRSPEFDLSQAIGRAVTGAITAAITAPFQLLYQPVALVAGAAGAGSRVALKPVLFAPGEAALDAPASAFVDGVARMLRERPRMSLQVCGRATAADFEAAAPPAQPAAGQPPPDRRAAIEAAKPRLQALAVERGRAVRRHLVERGGIPAGRIGECRSIFDAADRGPPRAEFDF